MFSPKKGCSIVMKRFISVLTLSFALAAGGCCNCPAPCCPAPQPTPDLISSVDLRQPPDLSQPKDMTYNSCTDRPCTKDGDCLPSFCRCSKPAGGKCSDALRCVYDPCAR